MIEGTDVAVIGAGMAGLATASELGRRRLSVEVFEASSRVGGRILTRREAGWPFPIELGAEFVHGKPAATLALAEAGGVPLERLSDRHALGSSGGLRDMGDVWGRFASILRRGENGGGDRSAQAFLEHARLGDDDRAFVKLLVEGFEAAPLDDISMQSIAAEANGSGAEPGQFRPAGGYGPLVRRLEGALRAAAVRVHLNAVVEQVDYRPRGPVRLHVRGADGREQTVQVRCAVVTVPVGVLAARERVGAIRFVPDISEHRRFFSLLGMGQVVKLVLGFRGRPWARSDAAAFDFLHSLDGRFPTFWVRATEEYSQVIAWAGGPRAGELASAGTPELTELAVGTLAELFDTPRSRLRDSLVMSHCHDFSGDPFARGAYSYARPSGVVARSALAEPVGKALYFAGEALDREHPGTVAGALESGARAARRVVADLVAN
jgi:monoamine oxidase